MGGKGDDRMGDTLWGYIVRTAARITERAFEGIGTLREWCDERDTRKREFMQMMGLEPMPERCDLDPITLGDFSGRGYRVEKVAYRILPDVWGSAHIYRPDPLPEGKSPAILYLCGHKPIGTHGYQQHGIMWARRGYICLLFDTIEQGDNPGDHHGLYYGRRFDWISLGYTPAGGELWNSIRALDLLLSLPEVDRDRVGATGISGGGAHSLFLAVADERVKAVASVAGTDSIETLVGHRHVWGHCDCMMPFNIYRRDTSELFALIAPRPLLLCFAIHDSLYTPAGWRGMYERIRKIYELYGKPDKCRLFEYPGPHSYQPETIEAISKWFDEHLAGEERPMIGLGEEEHEERTTTVFNGAPPEPDRLCLLPELKTRHGRVRLPSSLDEWEEAKKELRRRLLEAPLNWIERSEERLSMEMIGDYMEGERRHLVYKGEIEGVEVWLELITPKEPMGELVLAVLNPGESVREVMGRVGGWYPYAVFEPRGAGLSAPDPSNAIDFRHLVRSALWVGLTWTTIAIHDILKAIRFLRGEFEWRRIFLYGKGDAGVACVYAAALDEEVGGVVADSIPTTHLEGGHIIGILKVLDIPQALGMVAPRYLGLVNFGPYRSLWTERLYDRLGIRDRLFIGGLREAVGRMIRVGSRGA
jgi:dienelactone hydrolase